MRLLIISNMEHYQRAGQVVGWGPTVEEISELATIFDEIRHIACLHPGAGPDSFLPYRTEKVCPVFVPPAGGETFRGKVEILRLSPIYVRTILRELPRADAVHVRCPANLSLIALLVLVICSRPRLRWVKYAGSWDPRAGVAWTSKFQRSILNRGMQRGWVTVNGHWPGQPGHVRSFYNPCLHERDFAKFHAEALRKQLSLPIRIVFAGRLTGAKGTDRALKVMARLTELGIPAHLDLFGDSEERSAYEALTVQFGISHLVKFHGWLPAPDLLPHYLQAHFVLLPSDSEGWPKVLGEGMACGAVPVASRVGSIQQNLEQFGVGKTCAADDLQGYVNIISDYYENPEKWKKESEHALDAAKFFTYEHYIDSVQKLLGIEKI